MSNRRNESAEINEMYAAEREEARDAARHQNGPCYRHNMRPDGHGGGTCRCGETVGPEEI